MKKLSLIVILLLTLAIPTSAWSAKVGILKESDTTGNQIARESDALTNIGILKEYNPTVKLTVAGNDGTYSYILVDATGAYDIGILVTGTGNTFENVTIYAPNGVAMDTDENVTVTNCILEGGTDDINIESGNTVTAKNNLLHHSTTATDNIGDGTFSDTASVYALSPLFRNAAGQDFHLQAGSPAVGAGFNTGVDTDLDGMPTPRGVMDIGCYELFKNTSMMYMGMGLKGYYPFRED